MKNSSDSIIGSIKYGVLLIHFGTPCSSDVAAIRDYLKLLLSDKRVVSLPALLWKPMLCVIAKIRANRLAKQYTKIWLPNGSPLWVHAQCQAEYLQGRLNQVFANPVLVRCAMRYGEPSISSALNDMTQVGVTHFIIWPLYPQYALSTTASAFDQVWHYLSTCRIVPSIYTITHFFIHPDYINALTQSVLDHWNTYGQADKLLISFHGLPQQSLRNGEPYFEQCHATAKALAKSLSLKPNQWIVSFQSRFGLQKWLAPYTKDVLCELGAQHIQTLDVICPGFITDCLETLSEIRMEGASLFCKAGGKVFRYIPCLNSASYAVDMLFNMLHKKLSILFLSS
jgi:ferrochelatase